MKKQPKKISPEPEVEATSQEFDRFRDFAREIISVPKSEIDRRQAEYDEQPKPVGRNPFKTRTIPVQ